MSKYAAWGDYLTGSGRDEIRTGFAQIERAIGAKLPASAYQHRQWWNNNPSNNGMTQVWLDAGYRSEEVDLERRQLVFRRVRAPGRSGGNGDGFTAFYGKYRGLARIAPGYDLTEPADPELADYLDQKYGCATAAKKPA